MDLLTAGWRIIIFGIVAGSLYAPVAAGLVLVYRSSGVLNFAQGAFAFVGGYAFYFSADRLGLPVYVSVLAALVLTALLGLLIHRALVLPVTGKGPVVAVMMTIALSSVLEAAMFVAFGTNQRFLDNPFSSNGVHLPGGVTVSELDATIVLVSAVLLVALACTIRFSRFGIAVRAVSDSPLLAGYWGHNSGRVVSWTWALSFSLAAVAGIAYAMRSVLDSGMLTLGALVFPAVILGGMDSLGGAILGSVLLGIGAESATIYLGAQWSDFLVYAALLALLFLRPYGIFGTRDVARL